MKRTLFALALLMTHGALPAQTNTTDHAVHHADDLTSGEVRRVNKEQSKITLRHGAIKSLEMPAMTMVFEVRDTKLLDAVKTGDKVLFRVIKEPNGAIVVTDMKPAP